MTLPNTVTVAGVRLERRGLRMDYVGSGTIGTGLRVHKRGLYWRGQAVGYRLRGTRGEVQVTTLGVYTCPRRCAEALSRIIHGWGIKEYVT